MNTLCSTVMETTSLTEAWGLAGVSLVGLVMAVILADARRRGRRPAFLDDWVYLVLRWLQIVLAVSLAALAVPGLFVSPVHLVFTLASVFAVCWTAIFEIVLYIFLIEYVIENEEPWICTIGPLLSLLSVLSVPDLPRLPWWLRSFLAVLGNFLRHASLEFIWNTVCKRGGRNLRLTVEARVLLVMHIAAGIGGGIGVFFINSHIIYTVLLYPSMAVLDYCVMLLFKAYNRRLPASMPNLVVEGT